VKLPEYTFYDITPKYQEIPRSANRAREKPGRAQPTLDTQQSRLCRNQQRSRTPQYRDMNMLRESCETATQNAHDGAAAGSSHPKNRRPAAVAGQVGSM